MKLYDKIWLTISNPPEKKIQGIFVKSWQIPSLKDRKAMCKAIVEVLERREHAF